MLGHSAQVFVEHKPNSPVAWLACWRSIRPRCVFPMFPKGIEHFGGMLTSCGKFRPLARASALLDVARDAFVDARLGGFADDDRTLAADHLEALGAGDLLVMDRGYPSRQWMAQLCT
ncbi:MAG: hypothetical protein R3E34_07665 [Rhodocyclaceae bacterium]